MNTITLVQDKYLHQAQNSDKSDNQQGYLSYFKQLRWENQVLFSLKPLQTLLQQKTPFYRPFFRADQIGDPLPSLINKVPNWD